MDGVAVVQQEEEADEPGGGRRGQQRPLGVRLQPVPDGPQRSCRSEMVRSEMEREPLTWMNEIERVVRLHESFGEELLKEWPVRVIVPLL